MTNDDKTDHVVVYTSKAEEKRVEVEKLKVSNAQSIVGLIAGGVLTAVGVGIYYVSGMEELPKQIQDAVEGLSYFATAT